MDLKKVPLSFQAHQVRWSGIEVPVDRLAGPKDLGSVFDFRVEVRDRNGDWQPVLETGEEIGHVKWRRNKRHRVVEIFLPRSRRVITLGIEARLPVDWVVQTHKLREDGGLLVFLDGSIYEYSSKEDKAGMIKEAFEDYMASLKAQSIKP